MSEDSASCSECGTILPLSGERLPCPKCGGTRRTFNVHVVEGLAATAVANTASIIAQSFSSPSETSIVTLLDRPRSSAETSLEAAPKATKTVVLDPRFKLIFLSVLAITVACGAVEVILAATYRSPTPTQHDVLGSFDFAWKAGLGAIFGLLGGKQA